ncbi:hypothetical protein D3C85_636070 [compost metagenome]
MPIQLGVQPAIGDQLLVIAILGNAAAIEYQHPIRLFHRRQTMGDDQGGAAVEELAQGLMQGVLGGGIQGRGGLVENHHFRLGQHHAGDGQALALATGQAHPGAPDDAVQAIGQCADGAGQLGDFQGVPAGFVAALAAHAQVGAHRVVEQRRVLQHHRDLFAHGFQADLLLAAAAETNDPRLRRIEAEQQLHQGTLAAAAGADDGHLLARGDAQVEIFQHRLVAVGEGQPAHLDTDGVATLERIDTARVLRLVATREQLVDPRQRATGGVEGVLQVEQLLDRPDHEPQVAEHREHLADRQVGEQHGEHGSGAEYVDSELEQ